MRFPACLPVSRPPPRKAGRNPLNLFWIPEKNEDGLVSLLISDSKKYALHEKQAEGSKSLVLANGFGNINPNEGFTLNFYPDGQASDELLALSGIKRNGHNYARKESQLTHERFNRF